MFVVGVRFVKVGVKLIKMKCLILNRVQVRTEVAAKLNTTLIFLFAIFIFSLIWGERYEPKTHVFSLYCVRC